MGTTSPYTFDATAIADSLLAQSRLENFAGYDPFDGLNSVLFDRLGAKRFSLTRIAWLQLHKRSPINLRGLVGVAKKRNPKGIALVILGLIERRRVDRIATELDEAVALGDWLLAQSVDRKVWRHYAWGYHFDWAARAFYVPCGKPNAITTCYIARALYALGNVTGFARFTDAAVDAGRFLDDLYVPTEDAGYYAYIPGETTLVHNASLWSAAVVAESAVRSNDSGMRERALTAARLSSSMQREDGSWPYGARSHHGFIDGFHTGYNLEALSSLQAAFGTTEFSRVIDKGMRYYRRNFFLPDGTVKYYNDCIWPIDTHSVAQAVITLLKVGGSDEDRTLVDVVLSRAHRTLYLANENRFAYQKGRWLTNRINYFRWTQAWAFYALSFYIAEASNWRRHCDEAN
ncbi:prenyltransferase/squalene oxidase repeat-containing protein [Paraburkholderia megapolitana]|uniref:aspartate-semialdehyde dehydrogenase n=1 Tax=Paraburkholderia megapolitana TaxID=420953 RepID=UPI0038BD836C